MTESVNKHRWMDRLIQLAMVGLYCFIAFVVGAVSQSDVLENFSQIWMDSTESGEFADNIHVWADRPEQVQTGLVLITSQSLQNPAAVLVNNKGDVLHRWNIDRTLTNKASLDYHGLDAEKASKTFQTLVDASLYPNGDLLGVQYSLAANTYRGQRMFRMDKDSNILWEVTGAFHHDFSLAEDGTIYALDYEIHDDFPVVNHAPGSTEYTHDIVRVIAPEDGRLLASYSVPEAFMGSGFEHLLLDARLDLELQVTEKNTHGKPLLDMLHVNHVQRLPDSAADALPFAERGDLLLSMRGNNVIALLRPATGKIVWAKQGIWQHQHYVKAAADGTIHIFDNEGATVIFPAADEPEGVHALSLARVLAYHPVSGASDTLFFRPNDPLTHSFWRGSYHFLPQGHVLVSISDMSRIVEQDAEGNIVWELRGVAQREQSKVPYIRKITTVRHYPQDYAAFLR